MDWKGKTVGNRMKTTIFLVLAVWSAFALAGDADTTFYADVCNGREARFDKTVLLEGDDALDAAVAAGVKSFDVEEMDDVGGTSVRVASALDLSGERPVLAWTLPGVTRPLQVRSFKICSSVGVEHGRDGAPSPTLPIRREWTTDLCCRTENGKIVIGTRYFEVVHPEKGNGGQPISVLDRASGKVDKDLFLNDRTFTRNIGQYFSWKDPASTARVVFASPLMVVVEARMHYVDEQGRLSPDGLSAVYRYIYLANSPVVEIRILVTRAAEKSVKWDEIHFLELSARHDRFDRFLLGPKGDLKKVGAKGATSQSWGPQGWAVMMGDGTAAGVGGDWLCCYDNADGKFYRYASLGSHPMPAEQLVYRFAGALYYGPLLESPVWYAGHLGTARQPRILVSGGQSPKVEGQTPVTGGQTLEVAGTVLAFAGPEEGFACAGLREKSTGVSFFRAYGECPGLWRLEFSEGCGGAKTVLDNRNAKRGVAERTPEGLRFTWRNLDLADEPGVVDVVCDVAKENDAFAFRIRVANRSAKRGLSRTDYPLLGEVIPSGTGESLVPLWCNWGQRLVRNNRQSVRARYPSSALPMPFMAFHKGGAGVYIGCHDGGAAPKWLSVDARNNVSFEIPSENAGVPGAAGAPTCATVVAAYRGDWWRAAARYRAWALKQAWTAKGPIVARADYPRRLTENGFWLQLGGAPAAIERIVDQTLARMKDPVPFGVHWYCWHKIPFDNSYPEYFPAKDGFAEAVKRMTAKDVLIMPYINGRLWDRDIESFKAARPYATKQADGEPYFETYGSGRWLAAMCPATTYWGDRLSDICTRLVAECGVNAIYLDQIGAAAPALCYDASHGHPLGGGSHWVDGYRRLLTPIKARVKGTVLTTENTADPYMDTIDAYLTWTANKDDEVPALPAVYSGYTAWFASAGAPEDTPAAFRTYVLRDTLWGCQPGWMGNWILDDAHRKQFDTLVACGQLRRKYREFLSEGHLVGEVKNELRNPPFTVTWHCRERVQDATLRSVTALVWENPKGERAVFVANLSDTRRSFAGTSVDGTCITCELVPGEVRVFP